MALDAPPPRSRPATAGLLRQHKTKVPEVVERLTASSLARAARDTSGEWVARVGRGMQRAIESKCSSKPTPASKASGKQAAKSAGPGGRYTQPGPWGKRHVPPLSASMAGSMTSRSKSPAKVSQRRHFAAASSAPYDQSPSDEDDEEWVMVPKAARAVVTSYGSTGVVPGLAMYQHPKGKERGEKKKRVATKVPSPGPYSTAALPCPPKGGARANRPMVAFASSGGGRTSEVVLSCTNPALIGKDDGGGKEVPTLAALAAAAAGGGGGGKAGGGGGWQAVEGSGEEEEERATAGVDSMQLSRVGRTRGQRPETAGMYRGEGVGGLIGGW